MILLWVLLFVTYNFSILISCYASFIQEKTYSLIDIAGHAVLKVNVPAFKFEKAKEYNEMYEQAFSMS